MTTARKALLGAEVPVTIFMTNTDGSRHDADLGTMPLNETDCDLLAAVMAKRGFIVVDLAEFNAIKDKAETPPPAYGPEVKFLADRLAAYSRQLAHEGLRGLQGPGLIFSREDIVLLFDALARNEANKKAQAEGYPGPWKQQRDDQTSELVEAWHRDLWKLRPASEYHEDMGPVLWWFFNEHGKPCEAPYVGTPNDVGFTVQVNIDMTLRTHMDPAGEEHEMTASRNVGGWPGYHTHFSPIPKVNP